MSSKRKMEYSDPSKIRRNLVKKRRKKTQDEIKKYTTFKELLDHSVKWLNSETDVSTPTTPYMNGYVKVLQRKCDLQSIERMKDELIELNKLGFLTDGSQCGKIEHSSERAYVTGYMKKDMVKHVYKDVNQKGYILMATTLREYHCKEYHYGTRIPVTISYMESKEGKYRTSLTGMAPYWCEKYTSLMSPELVDKMEKEYLYVTAMDPIHGRLANTEKGLFTIIKNSITEFNG